jgi:hypothetical protein
VRLTFPSALGREVLKKGMSLMSTRGSLPAYIWCRSSIQFLQFPEYVSNRLASVSTLTLIGFRSIDGVDIGMQADLASAQLGGESVVP